MRSKSKRTVAILHICWIHWQNPTIENGSENIARAEILPDGTMQIEFRENIDHKSLSARIVESSTELALSNKSKTRVSFTPDKSLLLGDNHIIFECIA